MIIDTTKNYTATMVTSKGTLEIVLDALGAPTTVNSFVYLARWHYYDGIVFHRVIPGFVLQGGDPTGTGAGGPGYKFNDELPKPGRYELGSLAMANAGPHTNGSQFFVISGPERHSAPAALRALRQGREGPRRGRGDQRHRDVVRQAQRRRRHRVGDDHRVLKLDDVVTARHGDVTNDQAPPRRRRGARRHWATRRST